MGGSPGSLWSLPAPLAVELTLDRRRSSCRHGIFLPNGSPNRQQAPLVLDLQFAC